MGNEIVPIIPFLMTVRKDTTKDAPEGQDKGSLPFQWLATFV